MDGALRWSFESRALQMSRLAPILFGLIAIGCGVGRMPGLTDTAMGGTTDPPRTDGSGGQGGDTADAAPDLPRTTDLLVGNGGASGGARAGGTNGHGGVPGTGGRGLGGQGGTPGSPAICSGEVQGSRASRDPAEVLLTLDRSGSMANSIAGDCACGSAGSDPACGNSSGCTSRWRSLTAAIVSAMSSTPFLQWGLKFFPSPGGSSCTVTSGVEVPIGPDSATEIQSQIAATSPDSGTPTAAALTMAVAYLETLTDTKSKVILLATDGEPNCSVSSTSSSDDDIVGTVKAITAAREAGFLVYVIGIGPSVPNLDNFAQAGGTGRYYPTESPEDLTKALVSVSRAALCTFSLASMPPDPSNVVVYLDDSVVPQDASNGWGFGRDSLTILLHGSSCDQALAKPESIVEAVFGCGPSLPPRTLP